VKKSSVLVTDGFNYARRLPVGDTAGWQPALRLAAMKCFKHKTDAVAVCSYCGRAMCDDCITAPNVPRIVCSTGCATAQARDERAMQSILEKSVQSLKASAFYCYLCGGLSGGAAIVAWFMLPSPFLILFTGACAVVLIASGIWYTLVARKQV
jgi:hypothetical protein